MRRCVQQHAKRFAPQPSACGGPTGDGFDTGEFFDRVAEDRLAVARRRGPRDEEEAEPRHPRAFSRRSTPAAIPANAS